jgi:CDGSH-type Zn-finger protein
MAIQVQIRDNGPYLIRGEDIEVLDADGNVLPYEGRGVALCRCGESSTKPFCDGTHNKAGFESAPRAS